MKSWHYPILVFFIFSLCYSRIYEEFPRRLNISRKLVKNNSPKVKQTLQTRNLKTKIVQNRNLLEPLTFAGGTTAVALLLNKFGYKMQQNELDKMKHTVEKQRHLILNSEDKNEKKLNQISRILDEFEEETELLKDQMKDRFSDFEILIKSKIKIITMSKTPQ